MDVFKKRQSKIRWHWQPLLFHPHLILRRSRFKRQLRRIAHAAFTPLQGFEEFLQVLRSRHGNRTESPPANGFTGGGKWYACMVIARVVELVYPLSPVFFAGFWIKPSFFAFFAFWILNFYHRNHSTGGHHLNFTLMVQQLEMFQLPWSQHMTCLGSTNHLQPVGDRWLDAAGGCWFFWGNLFRSGCRISQETGNYLKASSIWKDATETCCMMFGKQILQKHPAWLKPI